MMILFDKIQIYYIKNLLVLFPLFFNGQLCNMEELLKAIKGI